MNEPITILDLGTLRVVYDPVTPINDEKCYILLENGMFIQDYKTASQAITAAEARERSAAVNRNRDQFFTMFDQAQDPQAAASVLAALLMRNAVTPHTLRDTVQTIVRDLHPTSPDAVATLAVINDVIARALIEQAAG